MRRRLLASYLVLVLAVLVALELPLGVLVTDHDESVLASQAEREATGLAILVGEDLEHHQEGQVATLAAQYRDRTGGEVTVVGVQGQVIASAGSDRDKDSQPDGSALVSRALAGHAVSKFNYDEGHAVAEAAVPLSADIRSPGAVLLDVPAGQAVTSARETWLLLSLFGAGALAVSVVVALALARSFSRPLADLEKSVKRLGRGDLAARSALSGPEEVRSLSEQFNRMAERLEELVLSQSRFVADASHQLRSPLTALRLRLENLEPDVGGHAATGVAAAVEEVQRLSRIVDGLLALTRAGSEYPTAEPVDVVRVIAQRCDSWAALADERGVALSAPPGPAAPDGAALTARHGGTTSTSRVALWVPGDLDQILDNLLANALDACPPGALISVRLVPEGLAAVNIHVTDNGPGLNADDRRRAFERFWQAPGKSDDGDTLRAGGGLGLAIVRELAARNQAEVELRETPGGGLDAVVRFSVVPVPKQGARSA